jgi:hypothetical protein
VACEFPPTETQIKSNQVGRGVPANDPITRFEGCPRIGFLVPMDVGPDFMSCRGGRGGKIKCPGATVGGAGGDAAPVVEASLPAAEVAMVK